MSGDTIISSLAVAGCSPTCTKHQVPRVECLVGVVDLLARGLCRDVEFCSTDEAIECQCESSSASSVPCIQHNPVALAITDRRAFNMNRAQRDDASALSQNDAGAVGDGNEGQVTGAAVERSIGAPAVPRGDRLAMLPYRLLLIQQEEQLQLHQALLDNERLLAHLSMAPSLPASDAATMGLERSLFPGMPHSLDTMLRAAGASVSTPNVAHLVLESMQRSQLLEQHLAVQLALSRHPSLVVQGIAFDPAAQQVGQQALHQAPHQGLPATTTNQDQSIAASPHHRPTQRSAVNSYNDPQLASMTQTFPVKLYRLILEAHEYHHGEIIIFSPTGEGFLMLDRDAFMSLLAPRYFRLHSFASFRRQLYLYGFVKCAHQGRKGYTHPGFRRDRPDLLCTIRRRFDYDFRKRRSVDVKVDSP